MGSSCYKCKHSHISPDRKPCDTCNIKSEWKPRPKETPKEDSMKVKGKWTMADIAKLGDRNCSKFKFEYFDFADCVRRDWPGIDWRIEMIADPIPSDIILKACGHSEVWKKFAVDNGIVEEEEKRYKKGQWFTWDRMTEDSIDKYLMLLEDDTQSDYNINELLVSGRSGLTFNLCLDFTPIDKSEVKL